MELAVRWIVIVGIVVAGQIAMGSDASSNPAPSTDQIQQWVAALESDSYSARHAATERLILAGQPAVEAVTRAIEQGGLETIIRGIYILRQLALSTSSIQTEAAAYDALQQISRRPVTTAARRAATAVQALDQIRYRRAEQHLEQLGTVISMTNVQVGPRLSQPFPSILIDESWRGSIEDLDWLPRITDARLPEGPEVWMLSLRGPQVTDAWLQRVSSLKNIRVVQLKSTGISNEALAHLQALPELRYVELLYTPITDAALPYLSSLKSFANQVVRDSDFTEGVSAAAGQLGRRRDRLPPGRVPRDRM